jgi:alpha,alpha-trehalose phosphorylase
MVIEYHAIPLNFSGELCFISKISTNVINHTRDTNPPIDYGPYGSALVTEKIHTDRNKTIIV